MVIITEDGTAKVIRPGGPTLGARIMSATLTAEDLDHPAFMEWFSTSVLTRFPPYGGPLPAHHPV